MLREYGRTINNKLLAEIVIMLYRAAHTLSTQKTYAVGQRHWIRFQLANPLVEFFPFPAISLNASTLSLCFFCGLPGFPTIDQEIYHRPQLYLSCQISLAGSGVPRGSVAHPAPPQDHARRPTPLAGADRRKRSIYPPLVHYASILHPDTIPPVTTVQSGSGTGFPCNATLWSVLPIHTGQTHRGPQVGPRTRLYLVRPGRPPLVT